MRQGILTVVMADGLTLAQPLIRDVLIIDSTDITSPVPRNCLEMAHMCVSPSRIAMSTMILQERHFLDRNMDHPIHGLVVTSANILFCPRTHASEPLKSGERRSMI
jgi:hypothetical protein